MKDGDKGYRAMLPCFYVEKTSEVIWCAQVPFALKTIVILFLKTYMRNCLKNSVDAVLVIYALAKVPIKRGMP